MFDYAQPLLNARKYLKELEEALLEKDHEKAFNVAIDVEAELMKLKNYAWKQARN